MAPIVLRRSVGGIQVDARTEDWCRQRESNPRPLVYKTTKQNTGLYKMMAAAAAR
jgi:hypothetical protein